MPCPYSFSLALLALLMTSWVHSWRYSRPLLSHPRQLWSLFALEMKEVVVLRQDRPESYEKRLMEALPANSTVLRWYISRMIDDDHALIEVVIREHSTKESQ